MFFKHIFKSPRVYLDYASSTPVDITMMKTLVPLSPLVRGANPSALHREGIAARAIVESARTKIATVLHAHRDEIIFTSGATESDNLAILGTIRQFLAKGILPSEIAIVASELEHAAVSETLARGVPEGILRMILPAPDGVVDTKGLLFAPEIKAVLVSVMYVNNEIGTVQPIKEIAKALRRIRKNRPELQIVFHVDATQAPLHFSLNVAQLGIDLMTLGATKLYATKGVGVLYKRRAVHLLPILFGGGQEQGLRPGTESIELIQQFAHALSYADSIREAETIRVTQLQHYFEQQIQTRFPDIRITCKELPRTPHITHIAISGMDSELFVIELDARGIAVSAKSACKNDLPALLRREQAEEDAESPIVEKLYGAHVGAIRFSFGRTTTKKQLDIALDALGSVLKKYQKI